MHKRAPNVVDVHKFKKKKVNIKMKFAEAWIQYKY